MLTVGWWHGCPAVFNPEAIHPVIKRSFGELWASTKQRLAVIEQMGFNLVYVNEHEWTLLKRSSFFD